MNLAKIVNKTINKCYDISYDLNLMNLYLRKSAHVIVFFVLGILIYTALSKTLCNAHIFYVGLGSLAFCMFVAAASEYLKKYITGRHCDWDEAALDLASAFIGIFIVFMASAIKRLRAFCKNGKNM